MANPVRGEREISVAGRSFTVAFGINAICEIEAALGENIGVVGNRLATGRVAVRDLRAILWGGLRRHHAALTVAAVGDLLERHLAGGGTLEEMAEGLFESLSAAFPGEEADQGNAPAPATTGRRAGKTSTARRSKRASTPIEPGA